MTTQQKQVAVAIRIALRCALADRQIAVHRNTLHAIARHVARVVAPERTDA